MADNGQQRSQMDKLIGTIRFAIIAGMIGAGAYFFGPFMLQQWKEFRSTEANGKEPDEKTKEADRREKLADDAVARVRNKGEEIASSAYPLAIGGVKYVKANLEGIARKDDGYQATVMLYYSNSLNKTYFLEILVSYDAIGGFRSWQIGRYNDPVPPNFHQIVMDRWPK